MIVYYYTNIDNLEQILALSPQGTPCIKLEARSRSFLTDDPHSIFGRFLLPSCIQNIEIDLGVKQEDSIIPLMQNKPLMEAILVSDKIFNDREMSLSQFIVSFYEDMDQIDLWTRYAEGGRGIAIGFDTDQLHKPFGQVFNFILQECSYWSKDIEKKGFQLNKNHPLYNDLKELYMSMVDSRVADSFKEMYYKDGPEYIVDQRVKETIIHNIITTFDLFQKSDEWKAEKEHRMTISAIGTEIFYKKDINGDYLPFVNIMFPIESLKIIMIGPKSGRYAYGMIQSLLFQRKMKQKVQILNSSCPM